MVDMQNLSVENLRYLGIIAAQNESDAAIKARVSFGNRAFLIDVVTTGKKTFLVLTMNGQFLGFVLADSMTEAKKEAAGKFKMQNFILDQIRIGNKAFAVYEVVGLPAKEKPQLSFVSVPQAEQVPISRVTESIPSETLEPVQEPEAVQVSEPPLPEQRSGSSSSSVRRTVAKEQFITEKAYEIQTGQKLKPQDIINLAKRGIRVQPSKK